MCLKDVDVNPSSRLSKFEECGMYQRKFASDCNLDVYSCHLVNLHMALFKTLNLMVLYNKRIKDFTSKFY